MTREPQVERTERDREGVLQGGSGGGQELPTAQTPPCQVWFKSCPSGWIHLLNRPVGDPRSKPYVQPAWPACAASPPSSASHRLPERGALTRLSFTKAFADHNQTPPASAKDAEWTSALSPSFPPCSLLWMPFGLLHQSASTLKHRCSPHLTSLFQSHRP